jgi:GntR family transcriptional regulator
MHTQDQILSALRIEDTGVPIYVQLREQFLQALGTGDLTPGDQMPTMRQVAVALKVDLNTVRHAYEELERLGCVVLVRGRGSFVATPPQPKSAIPITAIDNLARQTLAAAQANGVDALKLAQRLTELVTLKED